MSLHALANHLQSAGRGDDKVLIHMTPKEVKGLQAIAMAHGGSLTINPETGLPEAGFLDRMLPTLIGAGLMFVPGMQPLAAAAITGAGYGIAKGSLQEGLMAGLGAYGGAGLASGLSAAGAAGAQTAGSGASYGQWMGTDAGKLAGKQALEGVGTNVATNTGANVASSGAIQGASLNQPIIQKYPVADMPNAKDVMSRGFVNPPPATQVALQAPVSINPQSVFTGQAPNAIEAGSIRQAGLDKSMADSIAAQQKAGISSGTPSYWDNVKGGFREATGSWDGLKNVWDKTPTGTGYGLLATGMGIMQDSRNKGTGAPAASDSYIRPYDYSIEQDPNAYAPNASTAERKYFVEPRFTARPIEKVAKEGGLMSLNSYGIGGAVEQMSAENSVSGNTMYPQSQLQTAMYSNPMVQRPVQNDVINAGLDSPTQPYSGEMRMAEGGVARYNVGGSLTPWATGSSYNPGVPIASGQLYLGNPPPMASVPAASKPTDTAPSSYTAPKPLDPYIPKGQSAGNPDMSMVPNIQLPTLSTPEQQLGLGDFYAKMNQQLAQQGGYGSYAAGGMAGGGYNLGGYSDGGRLLKGPGDGVSDSIPASIGDRQPARLADGEFVVPARIVSELGNGSTEAGARKLYQMMERVQKARRKTVGKNQVAKNNKAEKLMPA